MAIVRGCCCFPDSRSGTMACAIYTLLYAFVLLFLTGLVFSLLNDRWTPRIVLTMFCIQFVAYSLVFVTSIIAMVGVAKDVVVLLVPYIVCLPLMMVAEVAGYITWESDTQGFILYNRAAMATVLTFLMFVGSLGLNILCLLCAISQCQELRAGRGRAADVAAYNNAATNVFMTLDLEEPVNTRTPPGVTVASCQ